MRDLQGYKPLRKFCREQQIDVVIPLSQRIYFSCGLIAQQLNIGLVLRLGIVRLPWRPIVDWCGYGLFPDAVVVNTHRIKNLLCRAPFVQLEKVQVIYNGIFPRNFATL